MRIKGNRFEFTKRFRLAVYCDQLTALDEKVWNLQFRLGFLRADFWVEF